MKTMSSFKCVGCGRTDFFTSHGLVKHGRKCKRPNAGPPSPSGRRIIMSGGANTKTYELLHYRTDRSKGKFTVPAGTPLGMVQDIGMRKLGIPYEDAELWVLYDV